MLDYLRGGLDVQSPVNAICYMAFFVWNYLNELPQRDCPDEVARRERCYFAEMPPVFSCQVLEVLDGADMVVGCCGPLSTFQKMDR